MALERVIVITEAELDPSYPLAHDGMLTLSSVVPRSTFACHIKDARVG